MTELNPNELVPYRDYWSLRAAYVAGRRPRILWSEHGLKRYVDMKKQGLTSDEVTDAICNPEEIGISRKHEAVLLTSGRVVVSVLIAPDGYPLAATLLWRTADDWLQSYEKGALEGRERRADLSHLPTARTTTY